MTKVVRISEMTVTSSSLVEHRRHNPDTTTPWPHINLNFIPFRKKFYLKKWISFQQPPVQSAQKLITNGPYKPNYCSTRKYFTLRIRVIVYKRLHHRFARLRRYRNNSNHRSKIDYDKHALPWYIRNIYAISSPDFILIYLLCKLIISW